jgi:hypothetical protein
MCDTTGIGNCRCNFKKHLKEPRCFDIHGIIRKVFSDHSWYTVEYIQCAVWNISAFVLPMKNRLIQNQDDIGTAFGYHFERVGKKGGEALATLLKAHIVAADRAATSAIINDGQFNENKVAFFQQGDDMSTQIATMLERKDQIEGLKKEFRTHNQHVLNLVSYLLAKKSASYIQELDSYQNHMLHLADQLVALAS